MKKISTLILFISLIQILSGCSQANRSNVYDAQARQQQTYKNQQPRKAQSTAKHSSQQTRSSAVVSRNPTRELMTKIAYSTIGTRYKWGGNNPQQGFDCSGLMRYVHQNALGITIPRTAAQQRDKSRTINYSQLQAGDMLFFKTGKNANHVGVYVGNRKFVHAASGSKHVKVASMDSSYWHKRFVKFGTFL